MGTTGELFRDRKKEEYRADDIDVELHVIEWPFEVVAARSAYDADAFREHFASTYGREGTLPFNAVEPAYRFGHELRENLSACEWSAVRPTARAIWERSSPLTWARSEVAIRHGWERARG